MSIEYFTPEDYEAAAENGITRHVATHRFYYYGWTKKRTINEPLKIKTNLYQQHKKTCDENGVTYGAFHKRVKRGMSPEEASNKPLLSKEERIKKMLGKRG